MKIMPEDTLALVIDYQEKLMPVIRDNEDVVNKSAILIKGLNELEVPIIVSQQYTKGLGNTIEPIAEALGDFEAFDKKSFSLMGDDNICRAVRLMGKSNVIVCGVEAHICVLQTVLDLIDEGYNVLVVEDCIGSRKPNDKKFACKRAVQEGAVLTTYEAVLYELTGGAYNEHFKAISKLTK